MTTPETNNNGLAVAFLQSGYLSGEKHLTPEERTNKLHYSRDTESRNWTWVTLVRGECSLHCAICEPWNNLWADLSQGMANSQMEPWNNLWVDLSQGMANSQMEPWNNLWADLSQDMANPQMEPRNTLWADLSQDMANPQMEPRNNLWADLSQGMANSQMEPWNNLWAELSQGIWLTHRWNPGTTSGLI